MGQSKTVKTSKAFALPTVLIASIVLLTILAVSVTATATVRTTLKNQYYIQLAQVAGESGVAYAKACLAANANVPQWTNAKPLTPATDCYGVIKTDPSVAALVVGGGGGGGSRHGGGGGGGGVLYDATLNITQTTYPVVVGGGGNGTASGSSPNADLATNGGNSSVFGLTAIGGGAGRGASPGVVGGSGGGGGVNNVGGNGTAGQGNSGGTGLFSTYYMGGGGGGAGGAGVNAAYPSPIEPSGGPGATSSITGSSLAYGAGGKGASYNVNTVGVAGGANTGNGGGGAGGETNGGAVGGSGVVVISYPSSSGIAATGGTVSTSGANTIHRFTASGSFVVTSAGTATCPTNPACSVTIDGNVRSSFSVPLPTLDSNGKALTIPNNGYVDILRTSNGSVWRTYKQPSVQAAVVPDLCSGNATAARGWGTPVTMPQQDSLPSASTAQTIGIAATAYSGTMYFRKDFNVGQTASYNLNVYTSTSLDIAETYIDGTLVATASGSVSALSLPLTSGCHVMVVKLTNAAAAARASDFTLSLVRPGAATPTVVSDTTWRVASGDPVHFSQNNYFEAPNVWEQVSPRGIWNDPSLPWGGNPTNWGNVSGDLVTQWISTSKYTNGTLAPGGYSALFRGTQPFTLATTDTVRVTMYCDNSCDLYLDSDYIMSGTSGPTSRSITIQPGTHTFGVRLNNDGTSPNPAGFLFSAFDLSSNTVVARSNVDWDVTTEWFASPIDSYSYDALFQPTPAVLPSASSRILVVGGGGGGGSDMGGGGGGGGVVYDAAHALFPGNYTVTVGSGGNGAPAGISQVRGYNGGDSVFDTLRAYGGGGGGSEYANNNSPPGSGASAGGSAGAIQTLRGSPVVGQGGGSSITPGSYYPTGGGGSSTGGAANPATGGTGTSNSILGTAYFFGGGGGGSGYTGIGGNGGNGGGGGGAVGTTTGGSGLTNGSPGGGGTTVAQTNKPGGNAGANTGGGGGGGSHYNSNNFGGDGGSGIVVISIPTGSMNITAPGAVVTTSGGFTIYRFNSSGAFRVDAINS